MVCNDPTMLGFVWDVGDGKQVEQNVSKSSNTGYTDIINYVKDEWGDNGVSRLEKYLNCFENEDLKNKMLTPNLLVEFLYITDFKFVYHMIVDKHAMKYYHLHGNGEHEGMPSNVAIYFAIWILLRTLLVWGVYFDATYFDIKEDKSSKEHTA